MAVDATRSKPVQREHTPAGALALATWLAICAPSFAGGLGDVSATYLEGRLTLRAKGAPAVLVAEKISEATGVAFGVSPELCGQPVSMEMEDAQLPLAIRAFAARIAGSGGYTMLYTASEEGAPRLSRIEIYWAGAGAPPEELLDAPVRPGANRVYPAAIGGVRPENRAPAAAFAEGLLRATRDAFAE